MLSLFSISLATITWAVIVYFKAIEKDFLNPCQTHCYTDKISSKRKMLAANYFGEFSIYVHIFCILSIFVVLYGLNKLSRSFRGRENVPQDVLAFQQSLLARVAVLEAQNAKLEQLLIHTQSQLEQNKVPSEMDMENSNIYITNHLFHVNSDVFMREQQLDVWDKYFQLQQTMPPMQALELKEYQKLKYALMNEEMPKVVSTEELFIVKGLSNYF